MVEPGARIAKRLIKMEDGRCETEDAMKSQ